MLLASGTGCAKDRLPIVPETEAAWELPRGSVVYRPAEKEGRKIIFESYVIEASVFRQMPEFYTETRSVWGLPRGSVVYLPAAEEGRMTLYDSFVVEKSLLRQLAEIMIGEPIPSGGAK